MKTILWIRSHSQWVRLDSVPISKVKNYNPTNLNQTFSKSIFSFSWGIIVIDLHDAGQFTSFQRSEAYSNVHRRIG
jgi:hypothetical protein